MSRKEETKKVRLAKLKYFLAAMGIFIGVYLICVLLMQMVEMLIVFPPYVELAFLLLFFAAAGWATKRIIRMRVIMNWINL